MIVGSLGDVYFIASSRIVRTISEYQQKYSARYSEHAILQGKPRLEYTGPGLSEISFQIQLHAMHGVNPENEISRLRNYVETGAAMDFILDGSPIGDDLWVITDMNCGNIQFNGTGGIIYCEVSLQLKEYISDTVSMMKGVSQSDY